MMHQLTTGLSGKNDIVRDRVMGLSRSTNRTGK